MSSRVFSYPDPGPIVRSDISPVGGHWKTGGIPKVGYRNFSQAAQARQSLVRDTGEFYGIYRCRVCGCLHVGRPPRGGLNPCTSKLTPAHSPHTSIPKLKRSYGQ